MNDATIIKVPMTWKEFRYLLINYGEDPVLGPILETKLHAMADRELYTAYKTATTEEARQDARRRYLDSRGIPESFRW